MGGNSDMFKSERFVVRLQTRDQNYSVAGAMTFRCCVLVLLFYYEA